MKRKQIIKPTARFARIIIMVFLQLVLITAFSNYANAQELNQSVISSGGETFTASGISLDFVIGEIVTESYTNQNVTLTQGFLQGTEGGLTINEHSINADDINIYPNPSRNMTYVMYKGLDKPISIDIISTQGYIVHSLQFINNPMAVNLEQLIPGLYVIRIIFSDYNNVTKRIIKK